MLEKIEKTNFSKQPINEVSEMLSRLNVAVAKKDDHFLTEVAECIWLNHPQYGGNFDYLANLELLKMDEDGKGKIQSRQLYERDLDELKLMIEDKVKAALRPRFASQESRFSH
jgi:hypothetical protein